MKAPRVPRRLPSLFALVAALVASPVSAQYMFLDMNGDGAHTAADVLSASGTTACDIYLRTDVNENGTPAVCATGCQGLYMTDPEFILRASGGSVTWGACSGYSPFFVAATDHNATDFYGRIAAGSPSPPGSYRLGSILVTATSGSPVLDFVPSTLMSGTYLTGFGSGCYGQEYDNTYKLGVDWGLPSVTWHVRGRVFSDDDASGICTPDPGEPGLSAVTLTIDPGSQTLLTDNNGDYDLCGVTPGTYTITATPPGGYEQSCPYYLQPWTVIVLGGQEFTGVNFALKPPLATISGYVFSDLNASGGSCVPDPGEPGLPGRIVSISPSAPGGSATGTNAAGYYRFGDLQSGTYTLTYLPAPGWPQSCPSGGASRTVFVSNQGTISNLDFAAITSATSYDLSVAVEGGNALRALNKTYGIHVRNDGQTVTGVNAVFHLPPQTTYVLNSAPGTFDAGTQTVTFPLGTMAAGQEYWLKVVVNVPGGLAIGTILTASAEVTPTAADLHVADNSSIETEPVRGSFDPNEKLVQPSGRILRSQTLAYHVGFQNTGNAPATSVVVRDTLDANLDPSTVVSGGSSHPYGFVRSGRILTWTFDDINLPDSTTSEEDSHGFVGFQVAPSSGAPDGAEIRNRASIYFDKNPPVQTTQAYNLIDSPPVLATIPDRTAIEGTAKDQPLSASDPQSDSLAFTLVSGPAYATVTTSTPSTGNLHLAPQAGDAGSATVVVRVSDGLLSDLDTCVVNVLTPTGVAETETFRAQQVRLNSIAETTCIALSPGSQAFRAADVDPATVSLSASGASTTSRALATGGGAGGVICFKTDDLRALLSTAASGVAPHSVWCEGRLVSGQPFSGMLPITVLTPPGALAASVTPNPLHAGGLLTFRTLRAGPVRASLFDVNGRRVRTLMAGARLLPGYRALPIDGQDDHGRPLASGIYFYRIEAAEGTQTGRFTVLR